MTCKTMREQLLEAELDELAGHGSSPVAAHVRGCAQCRTVAAQLLADTRQLAAAIAPAGSVSSIDTRARIRRPASHRRYLMLGTAAAAVLAFVIVLRGVVVQHGVPTGVEPSGAVPSAPATASPSPVSATPVVIAPAPMSNAVHSPHALYSASAAPSASTQPVQRPHLRPFPAAQPVAPTRIPPSPAHHDLVVADARSIVSVTPAHGKRAAVMRTRDPNVTVVWLY